MSDFVTHNSFSSAFNSDSSWTILNPIEQSIKTKIETIGTPLKDWDVNINRGILTGFNEAFVITGEKKDELISKDAKSADLIRPILRGRDVKRYSFNDPNLWLISTFPSKNYNIDDYPAVKQYLLSFGMEKLEQTGKKYDIDGVEIRARKKTNNKWFETQDSISYWDEFSKQKIVWKRIGSLLRFAYDDSGCVTLDSTCIATGKNIKYIAAILNTTLGNYMFKDSPKTGTGDLIVSVQAFEPIKIPQIEECEIQKFEELYDSISNCIKNGADYSAYENKLEELTFNLYGISDTEKEYIKEVSNKFFR